MTVEESREEKTKKARPGILLGRAFLRRVVAFQQNLADGGSQQFYLPTKQSLTTGAALGTQLVTPIRGTWLFVEFTNSHLFLDATPFDQFTETSHSLLGRLFLAKRKLNHFVC